MSDDGTIQKYKGADVIFKEGEPSSAAFVIVKGGVELTKNSKHGPVRLASLKAGELFGEMGVIDGSPRSATARALGPTTLKKIPPEALIRGIQSDPDLSSKVMSKLVERLRAADELLAKAGVSATGISAKATSSSKAAPDGVAKKKGFFSRLFGGDKGRQATFEILIADLFDDENNQMTAVLFEALKKTAQQVGNGLINVRRTDNPFTITDFSDSPMVWNQIKSNTQNWLREYDGDLLIWGQVRGREQNIHLRMTGAAHYRHERAGTINICDGIDLPHEIDDVLAGYLYGTMIAALVPTNKNQQDCLEGLLGPAVETARPAQQKRMRELEPEETARFETGYANLLAACAMTSKNPTLMREAEQVYVKVLRNLRRPKSALLESIIKRHLGYTQSAWFDLGGERNLLEAAIESLREACLGFEKNSFPNEWANLQASIGQLLFRKDQSQDDDLALKEAISAFQNALQVLSASTTPHRWGEAKHHLARALQLLGSQTGDLDMIARSAEACREALVVRSKTQTPMLWAATQNNLGSALFMLCQKTRKPETAEAAVRAFESALEVYQARNAQKLAQVTQKNLTRAQEVADDLTPLRLNETPSAQTDTFDINDFDDQEESQGSIVDVDDEPPAT